MKKSKGRKKNGYIWWKWNDPTITTRPQSTIKKELGNTNIGTNHVRTYEEPTKGFERPKVSTKKGGMETWVNKLIYGVMPP